jgi:2-polyprenyl-3-methyl-5-hydroxy-6-metoxy-1,4-benzoquinol methylase
VLDLLGDVAGLRVLDAGCGPGLYAEEVARRGAAAVGFDESPDMVRLARLRRDRAHREPGFIAFRLVKPA